MSALLAGLTAYFNAILELAKNPSVYVPAGVFLFVLWTYIGLSTIVYRHRPHLVRIAHDYAYGLIIDGSPSVSLGKLPDSHNVNPGGMAIVLNVPYRNVSHGPLLMKVEEMRLVLNGRTGDDSEGDLELFFPRLAALALKCPPVSINGNGNYSGKLTLKFVYGHPDTGLDRQYCLKLNKPGNPPALPG